MKIALDLGLYQSIRPYVGFVFQFDTKTQLALPPLSMNLELIRLRVNRKQPERKIGSSSGGRCGSRTKRILIPLTKPLQSI